MADSKVTDSEKNESDYNWFWPLFGFKNILNETVVDEDNKTDADEIENNKGKETEKSEESEKNEDEEKENTISSFFDLFRSEKNQMENIFKDINPLKGAGFVDLVEQMLLPPEANSLPSPKNNFALGKNKNEKSKYPNFRKINQSRKFCFGEEFTSKILSFKKSPEFYSNVQKIELANDIIHEWLSVRLEEEADVIIKGLRKYINSIYDSHDAKSIKDKKKNHSQILYENDFKLTIMAASRYAAELPEDFESSEEIEIKNDLSALMGLTLWNVNNFLKFGCYDTSSASPEKLSLSNITQIVESIKSPRPSLNHTSTDSHAYRVLSSRFDSNFNSYRKCFSIESSRLARGFDGSEKNALKEKDKIIAKTNKDESFKNTVKSLNELSVKFGLKSGSVSTRQNSIDKIKQTFGSSNHLNFASFLSRTQRNLNDEEINSYNFKSKKDDNDIKLRSKNSKILCCHQKPNENNNDSIERKSSSNKSDREINNLTCTDHKNKNIKKNSKNIYKSFVPPLDLNKVRPPNCL